MHPKRSWFKRLGLTLLAFLVLFIAYTIIFTEPRIHPIVPASSAPAVDYAALSDEAARDLQAYIRIATVRGREREGGRLRERGDHRQLRDVHVAQLFDGAKVS